MGESELMERQRHALSTILAVGSRLRLPLGSLLFFFLLIHRVCLTWLSQLSERPSMILTHHNLEKRKYLEKKVMI